MYIEIGYTGKSHGLQGELKLVIKERYEQDALQANVLFLEIKGKHIPFFVEEINIGNAWIAKLEDVDSREYADSLAGKGIYLREEDLLPPEAGDLFAEPNFDLFIGFEIVDTEMGPIGRIEEIYDVAQQFLASVQYQGREVLIPLHEELIQAVHEDVKELVMALPKGLLEL